MLGRKDAYLSFELVAFLFEQLNDVFDLFLAWSYAFVVWSVRLSSRFWRASGAVERAVVRRIEARYVAFLHVLQPFTVRSHFSFCLWHGEQHCSLCHPPPRLLHLLRSWLGSSIGKSLNVTKAPSLTAEVREYLVS